MYISGDIMGNICIVQPPEEHAPQVSKSFSLLRDFDQSVRVQTTDENVPIWYSGRTSGHQNLVSIFLGIDNYLKANC